MNSVNGDSGALYQSETTGTDLNETRPARDRYFDVLRAAAIARVVLFHMFPLAWLSMIFPSMGVMFALGGSLMAKSVERSAEQAIFGRLRRLLPSLWVMAALVVPAMVWIGWDDRPDWKSLLLWAVPLVEPPTSAWAEPVEGVLWYLVTYLWLVLLTPALLWLYRRAGMAMVVAPLLGLAVWDHLPLPVSDSVASAVTDVLTFAGCWLLGFAHRRRDLHRIPLAVLIPVSAVLTGAGLAWTITHPGEDGIELAAEPVAYGAYSLGFALLLMRWSPRVTWLERRRVLNGLVNLFNARAVTIYLWHNAAITLCFAVGDYVQVWRVGDQLAMAGYFVIAMVLLAIMVGLFGWVEDVAARRPVRLLPWGAAPPARPRVVRPPWTGPVPD